MGVDLGLKGTDFCFCKKVFFFFHFVVFVDGFKDVADAVEEFDAHFGEGVAFALGSHDVAYGFMVVGDRKPYGVGHGRECFLKFQDGEFGASLVFIGFVFEVGPGIKVSIVGNGGPDEGGEGGCHEFCDFCDVVVVESVVESGEEAGYSVECGFGGSSLFRVSLVDEEFHDHVEEADGDGVGDDDGEGEGEEVGGVGYGFMPCEEGKEEPEEDFQGEGVEEGPEPELAVVSFESFGHEACGDALKDGKSAVDEGCVGGDVEGAVKSGEGAYDGADYRAADESAKDDAYGTEVDDAATGADVPVGAADGHDGEHDDEYEDLLPGEVFGVYRFTEEGGPADKEKEQQEDGDAEPDVLDTEYPG